MAYSAGYANVLTLALGGVEGLLVSLEGISGATRAETCFS